MLQVGRLQHIGDFHNGFVTGMSGGKLCNLLVQACHYRHE
jgi:hypothetical protein